MTVVDRYPSPLIPWWAWGLITIVLYATSRAVKRLYFHPLKEFPGPKIAAMTYWYEMYNDIFLDGQYTFRIKEMHKKYGPVVRISPEELHFSSPDFYNIIFAPSADPKTKQAPKRHKWIRFVQMFGHPEISGFGTTDHDKHKMRRRPLEHFFSPAMVKKVAPTLILDKVEILCRRLGEESEKGSIRIKLPLSCYTTDVISDYAMGRSFDYLNRPDFFPEWSDVYQTLSRTGHLLKPWPFLFTLLDSMPEWLAKMANPGVAATVINNREARNYIQSIKDGKDVDQGNSRTHPSIFQELLNSDLPPEEKTLDRLQGDGQTLIGAGTDTTATVITTGIIRVLSHPDIEAKLRKELYDAMPDRDTLASLSTLERLPYLTAVIREALRMGYGIYSRCQRISEQPIPFGDFVVPPGTPMGMSAALMHVDETVFPEPERFDPERWMEPLESARLYRYLVPFVKGPRMCLGINLAYAELYMAFAALFRKFEMKLDDTCEEDLEIVADIFLPVFKKDQKEFRVFLTPTKE